MRCWLKTHKLRVLGKLVIYQKPYASTVQLSQQEHSYVHCIWEKNYSTRVHLAN